MLEMLQILKMPESWKNCQRREMNEMFEMYEMKMVAIAVDMQLGQKWQLPVSQLAFCVFVCVSAPFRLPPQASLIVLCVTVALCYNFQAFLLFQVQNLLPFAKVPVPAEFPRATGFQATSG